MKTLYFMYYDNPDTPPGAESTRRYESFSGGWVVDARNAMLRSSPDMIIKAVAEMNRNDARTEYYHLGEAWVG